MCRVVKVCSRLQAAVAGGVSFYMSPVYPSCADDTAAKARSPNTVQAINKPFPCYLVPLFENESSCKTSFTKMGLIYMKMEL